MNLIVDTNILLASFLKDAKTRELLLDIRLTLFAPEYLLSETSRKLKKGLPLRKRIHLSDERLEELVRMLTQNIQFVPLQSYKHLFPEGRALASHEEDAPYFALALFLDIPIWTNDKGFKEQDKIKIYSTGELIEHLGHGLKGRRVL